MKIRLFFCVTLFILIASNSKAQPEEGVLAVSTNDFLNSLGVCTSVSRRGESLGETIESMKYTGLRWVRVGYEDNAPVTDFITLYKKTGVKSSYGLLSGGANIDRLLSEAKELAKSGALLAFEGANEPNNWGVTYQGEKGGAKLSWLPVAKLHRDLYQAVKKDPALKDYPVWSTCENGAQTDNVGLQFLTIPEGANTLMPDGTVYADYANCHNYVAHPNLRTLIDNQTWLASSPSKDCPVDGLYGNYGRTWLNKYQGYSEEELLSLPRVTTETGYAIDEEKGVDEELQARLFLNLYLSQFKRGWKHTAVYLLKGRSNEPQHEKYAFFTLENKPKKAAHYMHNFTSILADKGQLSKPGVLNYSIKEQPKTTHDLLLQKSNGNFMLILWAEKFESKVPDNIMVDLGTKYKRVNVYDPTKGSKITQELKNINSLKLSLLDSPLIIEIIK